MLLLGQTSSAQIDLGGATIIQNGVPVGLVWVRSADPCDSTEYWYLGPNYTYPNSVGAGESIDTILRPLPDLTFDDVPAFVGFARQHFPGGKVLRVSAVELENCPQN